MEPREGAAARGALPPRLPPGAPGAARPAFPAPRPVGAGSFYGAAAAAAMRPAGAPAASLHDPNAPGALVLSPAGDARFRPPAAAAVVLDPLLSARLRPHQREGVLFLYESVMGLRGAQTGCLLCDDMGLGKTLQVVALLWTLLKQSPAAGGAAPAVRRALVVCPASLVATWRSEVRKWLGPTRLGVAAIGGGPKARAAFAAWAARGQTAQPLCVTSYETLRACAAEAAQAAPGLLICDEGHRLKSASGSKTLEALRALGAPKRVILSGTPVQNNLEEFHALVDFVAPGALGERAAFRRDVAAPIEAARDAGAGPAAQRAGAAQAAALAEKARAWLLRRTAEVNYKHLPPRQDYIVFCRPSAVQASMYEALLSVPEMRATLAGGGGSEAALPPLVAIALLRRLCTSPAEALRAPAGAGAAAADEEESAAAAAAAPDSPAARAVAAMRRAAGGAAAEDPALSGKMAALAAMLREVAATPHERIVLVAGWACTLDALGALCGSLGLVTCRVDGATPASARADIVRRFNAGSGGRGGAAAAARVCLLSTRAGGVGLSLIGARRLVLFDADWNPALDAQAAARVWRDGQKAPVAVYRLVTAGTLEETMLQRALVKGDVAAAVDCGDAGTGGAAGGGASRRFALAELRQLFAFKRGATCDTAARLAAGAAPWRDAAEQAAAADAPLRAAVAAGVVSFVHAPPPHGSAAALAAAASAEPDADADADAAADDDAVFDEEAAAEEAAEKAAAAAADDALRPAEASAAAIAEGSPPRSDGIAADDADDDDECVPESPPVPESPAFARGAIAGAGGGGDAGRSVRPRLE